MKTNSIKLLSIGLLALLAVSLSSCKETVVYYEDSAKIYFPSDSLYYTFGTSPISVTEYTYEFPVKVLGSGDHKERKFRVKVVEEGSTAVAGTHYKALDSEYSIPVNAVDGVVPITIKRSALGDLDEFKLILEVEANQDFGLGIVEKRKAIFQFTNALSKPRWWGDSSTYLGSFHPYKYLKFIELAGYEIPDEYDAWSADQFKYLKVFKKVKAYFEANPVEGLTFPDVVWPV